MAIKSSKQLVWFVVDAFTGVGLTLVRCILARGDRVIAASSARLELEKALSGADEDRLHIFPLDMAMPFEGIRQSMETAIERFGRVDVLVNSTGGPGSIGTSEEIGVDIFSKEFDRSLFGVVNCTTAILTHMRARNEGTIIIIGSRAAYHTETVGLSAYGAAKAALHAYGENLALDLSSTSIRVSVVIPSGVETTFNCVAPMNPRYDSSPGSTSQVSGTGGQPYDIEKDVDVVIDVVRGEGRAIGRSGWPLWLVLGEDALIDVKKRMHDLKQTMEEWGDLGSGLTFEGAEAS